MPDVILINRRITTMDPAQPEASAVALKDGLIAQVGTDADIVASKDAGTTVVDLGGRRVIPGLIDSHTHIIRQGDNFAMELRWDHVPSLADGLRMLKAQAERPPPGQWIRVVGGWSADQFAEKRLPTLSEINAVSPDVPVYAPHLYDRCWLNEAALRALGIDRHFYEPFVSGRLERDDNGEPTGLALARPNAQPLYALLDMAPKIDFEQQITSTKHYFRALNGLGLTSALDCAGGFLNYPDDYGVITELNKRGEQTVRIGYQLFAQRPLFELEDFKRWNDIVKPDQGDAYLKCVGAGEMLVASAYDFEDFSYPRPEPPKRMEGDLKPVLEFLFENRWPPAPTRRGSAPTIPGSRSIGRSAAGGAAAPSCGAKRTGSAATKPCAIGPPRARGSAAKRRRRGRSRPDNSPISPFWTATTSPFRKTI